MLDIYAGHNQSLEFGQKNCHSFIFNNDKQEFSIVLCVCPAFGLTLFPVSLLAAADMREKRKHTDSDIKMKDCELSHLHLQRTMMK